MTTNLAPGNRVTVASGIPLNGLQITDAPGIVWFRQQEFQKGEM